MNSLFQVICRMGIFMICAQTIVHFRPEEAYEKYIKLLVSAMALVQLFLPLGKLLLRGDGGEFPAKSEAFLRELETGMADAERDAYAADALLEQMSLEELRKRVEAAQESGGQESRGEGPGDGGEPGTVPDTDDIGGTTGITGIENIGVEEIRVQLSPDSGGRESP